MGYRGSIDINGKSCGEAGLFTIVNDLLVQNYLTKFKKRGAKRNKFWVEFNRLRDKSLVPTIEKYGTQTFKKSKEYKLYKKQLAKLGKCPIEEYYINNEAPSTSITLNFSKKEADELIDALLDIQAKLIDDMSYEYGYFSGDKWEKRKKTVRFWDEIAEYEKKYMSGEIFDDHVLKPRLNKKKLRTYLQNKDHAYRELLRDFHNDSSQTLIKYVYFIIKALRKAMKGKSKIKFHLYNG